MGNQVQKGFSFRFEIDNFSEKEDVIESPTFWSGGCEWYLEVYPKGKSDCEDHLSLYLFVANSESLANGWKRSVDMCFVVLNQSNKELYRSPISSSVQYCCDKAPGKGYPKVLPLSKLEEDGVLENDRLIVEVYISNVEVVEVAAEEEADVDINGFQVFPSQVTSVRKIFAEHPDIAEDFKPRNEVVKTEYMQVLLNLVETLDEPSQNYSETDLSNAYSELSELMEVGFKLDWLKSKLDEISLERKKSDDTDVSLVKEMEGRIKNLEMMVSDLKVKLDKYEARSWDDDFLLVDY
ncbi:MATH domain and coiled-coil domain-containing protein [Cardamine amara subsp. amara]|uniref:MATH domain and coiled-coil domain-containing protein n=1 Tax=Cardamine amara subsp. amara TaxID=228776 RepID=A0ABD1BRX1_CARAN